jgi:hypothetical protein
MMKREMARKVTRILEMKTVKVVKKSLVAVRQGLAVHAESYVAEIPPNAKSHVLESFAQVFSKRDRFHSDIKQICVSSLKLKKQLKSIFSLLS